MGVIVAIAALIPGFIIHKVLGLSYQGGLLGPIFSVLMIAVIGYFRDLHTKLDTEISLRKRAEEELRDHTNNLENLVQRRTSDLTTTNLELENEIAIRKKAEETLTVSERNYQEIFNATNEAIFIHDSGSGAILDVNRTMLEMYGYSNEEALKLNVDDVSSMEAPYTGEEAHAFMEMAINDGPQVFEWHARRKSGELFWVEVALKSTEVGGIGRVLAVVRDISYRKQIETDLHQAQKMEAIGTLAGGIAHDFNNILTAINGYSELAKLNLTSNIEQADKNLDKVLQGASRARDLVKQILTFSRKTEHEKQPSQLSFIVEDALKLLRASIPTTIEIKRDIASRSVVLADSTQIHQVIMNLCTNAYYAMRDQDGVLGIGLKDVDISPEMVLNEPEVVPGTYIRLEVSDNGCGMDDETKRKIFEPYFTTKGSGEGTGLGLAVVFGIVESHNGYINVYSEKSQGTTFHVYLPVLENETDILPLNKEEQSVVLTGGNERIIFVDDEDDITDFGKSVLSKYGYDVSIFSDGEHAFQEFSKNQDKYDLIITDMTMPHMTGLELAKKIIEIDADMPIVLCTGHSELVNREKALSAGISEYCEKPLSIKALLLTVRGVLDK